MTALHMQALSTLANARGQLFGWVPVFLGIGIGLWFALGFEPGLVSYGLVLAVGAASAAFWRFGPYLARPLAVAVLCAAAGFLAAGARAHLVWAPMLEQAYFGPVQGRVIDIDRSQTDALRLTLDQVVLAGLAPDATPASLRLSLHGPPIAFAIMPGQVVLLTGRLAAPEGPAEPGGFDFRRMAYFNQLGAVGYSATPVMLWQEPGAWEQTIARLRLTLSRGIEAAVPGDAGAFASGVMTGDRSGISAAVVQDLRVTSLAHLLAISGMNMAFLTGFVFALVRGGLALVPVVALRVNTKKIAAWGALAVATFYLALSGANVATLRAYLMMVVFLGAVLLDRRALSLRNVAISATVLLIWQPESLMAPGFQLSYAATVALIAGYSGTAARAIAARLPAGMGPVVGLVMTSLIAGFATAPFSAAEFNRFADYGLLANLVTVPVMSVLMGAGAVAALLAPMGLAAPALWVMGLCARWILFVAHAVAGWGGAQTAIAAPMDAVIPVFTLGAAFVLLWPGKAARLGLLPMVAAFGLWAVSPRPVGLISSDGVLVGIMGDDGRALSSPKGAGFAAESWLQDDGDLATPEDAAKRSGFTGPKPVRRFTLAGVSGAVLSGAAGLAALPATCGDTDLVILPVSLEAPGSPPGPCLLIGTAYLKESGAIALRPDPLGLWLEPVHNRARIWASPEPIRPPQFLPAKGQPGR